MIKNSGFRIRVQRELREKFLEICREQDKPAAQVLREYMREYVLEHHGAINEDGDGHVSPVQEQQKKGESK